MCVHGRVGRGEGAKEVPVWLRKQQEQRSRDKKKSKQATVMKGKCRAMPLVPVQLNSLWFAYESQVCGEGRRALCCSERRAWHLCCVGSS